MAVHNRRFMSRYRGVPSIQLKCRAASVVISSVQSKHAKPKQINYVLSVGLGLQGAFQIRLFALLKQSSISGFEGAMMVFLRRMNFC